MKKIIQPIFITSSFILYMLACKSPAYFPEQEMPNSIMRPSQLKMYDEGVYRLPICVKDTNIEDIIVNWFCDCDNPQKIDTVDQVCLIFIDETRAIFTKSVLNNTSIRLDCAPYKHCFMKGKNPCKMIKLGLYSFMAMDTSGNSMLRIRVRSPKVKDTQKEFSDLYFKVVSDTSLLFDRMEYYKYDSNIASLKPKRRKNLPLQLRPLGPSPEDGVTTIDQKAFAIKNMAYSFLPVRPRLMIGRDTVTKIQTNQGGGQMFRLTFLSSGKTIVEKYSDSLTIKTW